MLIMRVILLLAVLAIGGSLLLWFVTGNPRYLSWAWTCGRVALVVMFVLLALFALERVLVPVG